jgi:hypothetical protein
VDCARPSLATGDCASANAKASKPRLNSVFTPLPHVRRDVFLQMRHSWTSVSAFRGLSGCEGGLRFDEMAPARGREQPILSLGSARGAHPRKAQCRTGLFTARRTCLRSATASEGTEHPLQGLSECSRKNTLKPEAQRHGKQGLRQAHRGHGLRQRSERARVSRCEHPSPGRVRPAAADAQGAQGQGTRTAAAARDADGAEAATCCN